ncbi:rRNA maturation RNase YbeY [Ferrovibrio sp.]|uniref:rRNA maturation RNase YbeY n=1 Tax=Ferrovibrio sp. TaxID=1917215 RepID=UPI0035194578
MPDDPGPSTRSRRSRSRAVSAEIDIRIAAAAWRAALPGPAAAIRRAVTAALAAELPAGCRTALSILLTDDAEMRKLNAGWREKDKPTNVLSFPAEAAVDPEHPPPYLGDIALGLATCAREAKAQGKSLADHVAHLAVHGALHLLGYDHMTADEAAAMEPREVDILAGLGIADPYRLPAKRKAAKAAVKKP